MWYSKLFASQDGLVHLLLIPLIIVKVQVIPLNADGPQLNAARKNQILNYLLKKENNIAFKDVMMLIKRYPQPSMNWSSSS
jgi:hypothetical protein